MQWLFLLQWDVDMIFYCCTLFLYSVAFLLYFVALVRLLWFPLANKSTFTSFFFGLGYSESRIEYYLLLFVSLHDSLVVPISFEHNRCSDTLFLHLLHHLIFVLSSQCTCQLFPLFVRVVFSNFLSLFMGILLNISEKKLTNISFEIMNLAHLSMNEV